MKLVTEMVVNPTQFTKRVTEMCKISCSSVEKILQANKFNPYKMRTVQELTEYEPDRLESFVSL